MKNKKLYIPPVTTIVGCESSDPIMGTMTLYTASPYVDMTTVSFGPGTSGYGWSGGQW